MDALSRGLLLALTIVGSVGLLILLPVLLSAGFKPLSYRENAWLRIWAFIAAPGLSRPCFSRMRMSPGASAER